MKKTIFIVFFLVLLCNPAVLLAQTEPEQIKPETDKFQDYFYESLLQKGIENYDKAIMALEQCLKINPNDATVYFELGKNQLALKDYASAYNSFERATQIDQKNKWFWVGMYDVCYETKNFEQGINIINKLIPFDEQFKNDLISLYMSTKQFDKALDIINEMNDKFGKSERRQLYKAQILLDGKYHDAEISNLVSQITKNPKEESNYVALIKLYSKNNEDAKVYETAKKLEVEIPTSAWAQVSLFKDYMDNKEYSKAIKAMNIVLANAKEDSKIKHRILNEFLIFVYLNPQFAPELDKAITYFDHDDEVDVAKEIGKFYHNKKQWNNAIKYYERALKNRTIEDLETDLLLLQAYTETKQFEIVAQKSIAMIEIFPTESRFYYHSGLAYNQLLQFKKAKDVLEMGLDFLVNDTPLEINFNIQLGEAYNGLGNIKKKEFYFSKADQLLKHNK